MSRFVEVLEDGFITVTPPKKKPIAKFIIKGGFYVTKSGEIKKIIEQRGDKWVIVSEKDPNKILGTFATEEEAKKRLKQIEAFNNVDKSTIKKLQAKRNK